MKRFSPLALLLALPFAACTNAGTAPARNGASTRSPDIARDDFLPPLEHAVSVRDGRTGERLTWDELLTRLAPSHAVFLGETHIDETTHRVELGVYEGLLARRKQVVLAMEMFERDVQGAVDAYLAGTIDEPTFLARSRPWSNYKTAYRPMIELAKAKRAPVVASNFPATLRSKVSAEKGGLKALSAEERAFAPKELLANTPGYWRRVDNAIRGHVGMMGPRPAADDPRLLDTQSLWDNTMGESCALALDRHPGALVVHVNGGFHSEYWDGTARQLALRKPNAKVKTVAIVTSSNPQSEDVAGLPVADYVVFAHERAQDVNEGTYSVFTARQLQYRVNVPHGAREKLPLLVWLGDDGESAEDAMELWKARLGDACVLLVVEAPYRETQEDLSIGGRWYWPDSFREDLGALRPGIAEIYGYALRHFPVDPKRVVLAGEGTGATVVASSVLLTDGLGVTGLALGPTRYTSLKDFPLPLPELRGDLPKTKKALRVFAAGGDMEWWKGELAEYTGVGLENSLAELAPLVRDGVHDDARDELDLENAVRTALGLAARVVKDDAPRRFLVVGESVRARSWGRLLAQDYLAKGELVALWRGLWDLPPGTSNVGGAERITPPVDASAFAAGAALPRAPGPFGGTTVIVLPDDLPQAERDAWTELQKNDPLNKSSRFHRFVLAAQSGERALPVVLEELIAKNRKNVLVVPARWCADGDELRALKKLARPFENMMTLHWRPGLGGVRAASPH
ncbi:MAG: ChaN family lipoprotein [Planctomycetes bacterium]|nr:ChaN family lipoprotein [Planctomycetota bacterium]